jgi:hypothetical protein
MRGLDKLLGVMLAGALFFGACSKEKESLVLVAVTGTPPDTTLKTLHLTVGATTKTFDLATGLGATAITYGVYVGSSEIGKVDVSASATGTDPCDSYMGFGSASISEAGDTANVSIPLSRQPGCATDGGLDAQPGVGGGGGGVTGSGGSGTGGTGVGGGGGHVGTGGGGGSGTGGSGTGGGNVASLNCVAYNHNETTTACSLTSGVNDTTIYGVAFSHDSKYLFSSGDDGRVKVWNWDGHTITAEGTVFSSTGATYLALSDSNMLVAEGSEFGDVSIWNIGPWTLAATLNGVFGDVYGLAFAPDGKTLYTIDSDSVLSVFVSTSTDIDSSVQLRSTTFVLAASPLESDGTYWLAIGYDDGGASLINVASDGSLGAEIPFIVTSGSPTYALQFSHDGKFLAAGAEDGTVGIWSVPLSTTTDPISPPLSITTTWIDYLAFSPSDANLAIAAGGTIATRQLGIWNVATGAEVSSAPLPSLAYQPYSVAYTADGKTIAAGEHDCGIILVCPTN